MVLIVFYSLKCKRLNSQRPSRTHSPSSDDEEDKWLEAVTEERKINK